MDIGERIVPLSLQEYADEFAGELNQLVKNVFPGTNPKFSALALDEEGTRVSVTTRSELKNVPLILSIAKRRGIPKIHASIEFRCHWSSERNFLSVDESYMDLKIADNPNPLFRYEFDKKIHDSLPTAHLHIHAHRDEIAWLMIQGRSKRPKALIKQQKMPILSSIHFPLGGERFRPSIEDFFEFSINEFGLSTRSGAQKALENGRIKWKRKQLHAAIFDSQIEAANALESLGWKIMLPEKGTAEPRIRSIKKL